MEMRLNQMTGSKWKSVMAVSAFVVFGLVQMSGAVIAADIDKSVQKAHSPVTADTGHMEAAIALRSNDAILIASSEISPLASKGSVPVLSISEAVNNEYIENDSSSEPTSANSSTLGLNSKVGNSDIRRVLMFFGISGRYQSSPAIEYSRSTPIDDDPASLKSSYSDIGEASLDF